MDNTLLQIVPIVNPLDHLIYIENTCFPEDTLTISELRTFWDLNRVILLEEGCLLFIPSKEETRIYSIAVLPEHRGKGIAKCLIDKLGDIRLTLECKKDNVDLYVHLGFVVVGEIANYYENGETAYKMLRL
jgi:ribosomal protein S18 acetylase RimI-like enzyme